jgi:hypothetical protein
VFGQDIRPFLPRHLQKFSAELGQFPKNYEKWVYATSLPKEIYQGDVVARAPFALVNAEGSPDRLDVPGMVISCTCDVQLGQGDFALIAPVHDLDEYRSNSEIKGQELENHLRALTGNEISNLFFLPAGRGLKPSFVDLGMMTSISIEYLNSERGRQRLASLSQVGHYVLLVKLAYHFTRPEGSDAIRG